MIFKRPLSLFVSLPLDKTKMYLLQLAGTFLSSRILRFGETCVSGRLVGDVSKMAKYRPKTPDWFDTRKAAQVVAFFALKSGGKINVLKATKLVYLADRLSIERRDHAITNDSYVSMPFGPVNTNTYDYMNGKGSIRQDEWNSFIANRADYNLPLAKGVTLEALDELSRSDLKVLEDTWEEFKDIEKYELAEWTHRFCPEWQNPGESSIPIEFSTIFRKLNKADPGEMAEEIEAERKLRLDLLAG